STHDMSDVIKPQPEDLEHFVKPSLEDRSIRWLKKFFEKKFDGNDWKDFEAEMLLVVLAESMNEVIPLETIKKVLLLKAMEDDSERFYDDPLFMLHAVEILNNTSHTSSDSVPSVTSLELAYAVN